ncbi:MAG: peptidyl-tRNA hydrolase [Peptococcaceae bacterium BRH_c4a]|nr:MAG: peptidyl-tRNA hydrolase [Peptococcaceae bacterium BRH_c4a]
MYLVVGLGNPGREYAGTRHNMGFRLVDLLSGKLKAPVGKNIFKAYTGRALLSGKTVILAKPQTFMNLSGNSVAALMNWFKIPPSDIVVAYDDLDLPPGRIRLKPDGGHGGHRGMESVIEKLGTGIFPRVRIGIGRPPHPGYEVTDWVLGKPAGEEEHLLGPALEKAAEAVITLINEGIDAAMNRHNRQP